MRTTLLFILIRTARTSEILISRKAVIIGKRNTNSPGKRETLRAKWYRHVFRMGDNRWPKRICNRSLEGQKRRRSPEMKWEREVGRVMKQKNRNTCRHSKPSNIAKSDLEQVTCVMLGNCYT